MAIIGDLHDIGLPDLLSLLTLRRMTGQLMLQHSDDDAVLEFQAGRLVRVTSSYLSQPSGDLLVQCGALSPQHLAEVVERQASRPGRALFGTLLLEHSLVPRAELEAVLVYQAQEILTRVVTWVGAKKQHGQRPYKGMKMGGTLRAWLVVPGSKNVGAGEPIAKPVEKAGPGAPRIIRVLPLRCG